MTVSVTLPELGESVAEGTVTRWLKNVGDTVAQDEPLVEIATDKVDTEIPSPVSGVIVEICAQEDDTVEIGGVLARIADPREATPAAGEPTPSSDGTAASETPANGTVTGAGESTTTDIATGISASTVTGAEENTATGAAITNPDSGLAGTAPSPTMSGKHAQPEDEQNAQQPSVESDGTHYFEVLMPELGESVAEGTVTHWCKKLGEQIAEDEPLLEVSTDKVDTEIPSPASGVLVQICAVEDETIEVGRVVAVLQVGAAAPATPAPAAATPAAPAPADSVNEDSLAVAPVAESAEKDVASPIDEAAFDTNSELNTDAAPTMPSAATPTPEEVSYVSARVPQDTPSFDNVPGVSLLRDVSRASTDHSYVTPLVRKVAADKGVDLAHVQGSGLGGRILKKDVLAAAALNSLTASTRADTLPDSATDEGENSAALRGTTRPASPIRQSTARTALAAVQSAAQVSQVVEVDLTNLLRQLASQHSAEPSLALSLRACVTYAVARVLRHHPVVNASYDKQNQQITYHENIDIAIGVDTPQGLLSPVLHYADQYSLADIGQQLRDMEDRCLSGTLTPAELSGGTFVLAHPSASGVLWETPLVVPPQSAALAVGTAVQRPVVVDDTGGSAIAIRAMSYLALSYDACLVDSPAASRFLRDLQRALQEASFLDDIDDTNALS